MRVTDFIRVLKTSKLARGLFLNTFISSKFPLFLFVEATNNCNSSCRFCPRLQGNRKLGYLDFNLYKKLIDESVKYGKRGVIGLAKDGEPLLHPKIDELIKYANDKKAAHIIQITTNASLLNEGMSKKILNSGLDDLRISIDAVNPDTYKKLKGHDYLEKVEKNVNDFLKLRNENKLKKPFVRVKFLKLEENHNEEKEFIIKWKNKADWVETSCFFKWGDIEDLDLKSNHKDNKRYVCNYPWYWMTIDYQGNVSPCCLDYNSSLIMGNVNNNTIEEIWNNGAFKKFRRAHLNLDFKDYPICRECTGWQVDANIGNLLKLRKKMI